MESNRLQRGVVAVEFAIVLPVLLSLIFGVFEFGVALYDQAIITNASREAARAGVVVRKVKATIPQIKTVGMNYCKEYLISFGNTVSPDVSVSESTNPDFSTPQLNVTVSYTYVGLLLGPLLSAITGPMRLSATAVMIEE